MPGPGLILFDDARARRWEPFALTRPAGELLFGAMKLVERAERMLSLACIGYLTSDHHIDYSEPEGRPVLGADALPRDRDLLFWCARAILDEPPELSSLDAVTTLSIDGRPVGLYVPAGAEPDPGLIDRLEPDAAPAAERAVRGRLLEWPWDLLLESPEQVARDLAGDGPAPEAELPQGVYRLGGQPLWLGRNVELEPGVLLDTRQGPIRLGDDVEVRAGTRLAGPAVVGRRSRLLGDALEALSAGPYSYVHGEVSECVMLGYVNKAHGGHLGHAYLGRWVNLGAFTTNSDLKNNYRSVKVWTPEGLRDSGRIKLGCFMGDHVKTGIGLLLGTGTVVGAGANIYGSNMPPRYVEPFSWGEGDELGEYRLADFLDTAAAVMARRNVELDERGRRHLERCWRKGRGG